jgi:hypothetical protein
MKLKKSHFNLLNAKRGELMQKKLVAIAIAVLAGLLLLMFHMRFFGFFSTEPSDIVNCQQSLLLASTALTRSMHDVTAMNIRCQANVFNVTEKELQRLSSLERTENTRLKADYPIYQNEVQYKADTIIWQEANTCYQKVFYGKQALFSRAIFEETDTFCMICAVITFDESAQGLVAKGNAAPLLFEKPTDKVSNKTLFEHASDHQYLALGAINLEYETNQPIAIMYQRANSPLLAPFYVAVYETLLHTKEATEEHLGIIGPKSNIAIAEDGTVTYTQINGRLSEIKDFEMIRAVPYTKESLSHCTILVSEVIVNG